MMTLAQEAAALRKLKLAVTKAKQQAEQLTAEATQAELALFERMGAEGVNGIKVGSTSFVPVETQYGQVQDRAEFLEWCEDNCHSELVELRERKALVNEVVRECLDNGTPLPPGLGFYVRSYISQRG